MPRPILYFARHGETDWNRERRLQGQHDIPLNALGRVQASRCGELLRGLLERDGRPAAQYDYVSSPLGRARETMELMRAAMGLDPGAYRTDARLMEMSFGRWEGFTFAELQAREARGAGRARARQMGLRAAGRRELRAAPGPGARLVREPGARQRGVGAWRRVPGADRASRFGAARGGLDGRYRAGAASTCSTATAWRATSSDSKSRAAGLSSGRSGETPQGRLANLKAMRSLARSASVQLGLLRRLLLLLLLLHGHGRDPLRECCSSAGGLTERRGFGPWARPLTVNDDGIGARRATEKWKKR